MTRSPALGWALQRSVRRQFASLAKGDWNYLFISVPGRVLARRRRWRRRRRRGGEARRLSALVDAEERAPRHRGRDGEGRGGGGPGGRGPGRAAAIPRGVARTRGRGGRRPQPADRRPTEHAPGDCQRHCGARGAALQISALTQRESHQIGRAVVPHRLGRALLEVLGAQPGSRCAVPLCGYPGQ